MTQQPSCPHLPPCPGCPRFGAQDPAPGPLGQLEQLCGLHGASVDVRTGARERFRHRARLAVRGRSGSPKVGIFAEGTHRIVDIPRCPIHHPLINLVAAELKAAMRRVRATCYADEPHAGLVRAVQVTVERQTQTAQLVLVCNASEPTPALPLLEELERRLGPRLHSLFFNANPERTNVILGPRFVHLAGPPALVESLGGARVFFPPGAFGQNNLDLFDALLADVQREVPSNAHVVELYAGCGSIGLGLVARSQSVVFNEIGAASLEGLARGIEALPAGHRERTQVISGPAELGAQAIGPESVVIVDPPRKGLGPALLDGLSRSAPARLVYVSCGLASFIRDTEALTAGGLALESATAYDLFPFTSHIETLAVFRRASASDRRTRARP